MATNPKKEFWQTYKPPEHYVYLSDEEVINCIRFVRDRTLSLLVKKFYDERPTMAKTGGMLECIDRCHRQIEMAYRILEMGDSVERDESGRDISIGYEKQLPAQDQDRIDA